MEIHFERLSEPLHPAYLGMTFAEHRPALSSLGSSRDLIAIGATMGGEPVGLGLAQLNLEEAVGTVLSLLIIPALQGRGLGTALLEVMEHVLARSECLRGRIFFSTELPSAPAMERLLEKAGWTTPRRHMLIARVRDPSGGDTLRHFARLRADPRLSVFPWVDLTIHERKELERHRANIPHTVWPFLEEDEPLEPAVSLGLRHGNEVVGWLIAHRIGPNQLRLTSLYVRERWRSTKAPLMLLREAEQRHRKLLGHEVCPTFGVLADNEPMIRLVERHFRLSCYPFQEIRIAEKVITC